MIKVVRLQSLKLYWGYYEQSHVLCCSSIGATVKCRGKLRFKLIPYHNSFSFLNTQIEANRSLAVLIADIYPFSLSFHRPAFPFPLSTSSFLPLSYCLYHTPHILLPDPPSISSPFTHSLWFNLSHHPGLPLWATAQLSFHAVQLMSPPSLGARLVSDWQHQLTLSPAQDFPEALLLQLGESVEKWEDFGLQKGRIQDQEETVCPLLFFVSVIIWLPDFPPCSFLPYSIPGHSQGEQLNLPDKHTLYKTGGMPPLLPLQPSSPPSWFLFASLVALSALLLSCPSLSLHPGRSLMYVSPKQKKKNPCQRDID